MPLYEYECEKCGHRFERIQKFSDPPADRCPKCGAESVHKLISSPAIQFKGTGWYITDYARKDSSPKESDKAKSEKATGAESAAASGDKTDKSSDKSVKSDAKTESKSESTPAKTSTSSSS